MKKQCRENEESKENCWKSYADTVHGLAAFSRVMLLSDSFSVTGAVFNFFNTLFSPIASKQTFAIFWTS